MRGGGGVLSLDGCICANSGITEMVMFGLLQLLSWLGAPLDIQWTSVWVLFLLL